MKTPILLAAGAAALLTSAAFVPAAFAQPVATTVVTAPGPDTGNWTLKRREDWLSDHINKAHDEHAIDGHEADRAHHALDRIRDDENHMRDRHDGQLTDNETADLEARLDAMAAQIHWAHDNNFARPW